METIKCQECGCIMGAASEICPVCGAPVAKQKDNVERQALVQEEVVAKEQLQQMLSKTSLFF